MDNEKTHLEVSRRNAGSVLAILAEQDSKIHDQQKRIDGLVASMSILMDRMNQMEHTVGLQKARQMGNGPTVKS